jgi:hypothetical protein
MRRLRKAVVLGVACLAAGFLGVRLSRPAKEPVYDGRPLSFWLHQLPITMIQPGGGTPAPSTGLVGPFVMTAQSMKALGHIYGGTRVEPSASLSAIQRLGTNAVPLVIRKLSSRRLDWFGHLCALASHVGIKRTFLFTDSEIERGQATTALLVLSPLPDYAIDELRRMSTDTNSTSGASAAYILKAQTEWRMKLVLTRYQ